MPEKSINIKKSCHYGQVKIPVDGGTDACRFNANVCRMAHRCGQELHQNRVVQPCRPETHRGTAQCPAGHYRCQAAEGGTLFGQHGHDEGTLQTVNAEHLRFRHGESVLQGNRQLCLRHHPECTGTDKDGQQGEVHQPALLSDGIGRAGDGNTAAGGQLRKHREQCEDSQSAQGRRHCREEERRLQHARPLRTDVAGQLHLHPPE